MHICPDFDVHSAYIDGELPLELKNEYLEHVNSCKKCDKELKKLQIIHKVLREDNKEIWLSESTVVKGYEKIETLLKCKQIAKYSQINPQFLSKLTTVAAAFAVFIIFLSFETIFLNHTQDKFADAYKDFGIQSPFTSENLSIPFPYTIDDSLLTSAENLQNIELENIIAKEAKKSRENIFYPKQNQQKPDFVALPNMYNNKNNLYNTGHSGF
ncbi:MAG: hypothetical protein ACTTHG_06080 [Treponemataceae bacterium]